MNIQHSNTSNETHKVDFCYSPLWWQTLICLPDSPRKTLVCKEGDLAYDFSMSYRPTILDFKTRIRLDSLEESAWEKQELLDPQIPIIRTYRSAGSVEIMSEAFAEISPSHRDVLLAHYINKGKETVFITPVLRIEGEKLQVLENSDKKYLSIHDSMFIYLTHPFTLQKNSESEAIIRFEALEIPTKTTVTIAAGVTTECHKSSSTLCIHDLIQERESVVSYWREIDLPYQTMQVPDKGIQAVLDSSIRNIYQAREFKDNLPVFQVGPTCYRGLWVVDGAFLMEAMTMLGRVEEARNGIHYLMQKQRPDGGFMLIDGHWKETGIVLWIISRFARLTHDKKWLRENWGKFEQAFSYIKSLRENASQNPLDSHFRLMPSGFPDGGLMDQKPEYTNVYWSLAGMRAAIESAQWIDNCEQANEWQEEYNDFYSTFIRAAETDMRTDSFGNRYLPVYMGEAGEGISPQKAQWAFLQGVFPGKVFDKNNPIVEGNMKMMHSAEVEGLVLDSGWAENGIWNYLASFYAHAWLWIGDRQKAIDTLYAFANHASPLLVWREEQMPKAEASNYYVGDMPHNWASAEFIRLVRHLLILERGDDLHLFEGLPHEWTQPGMMTDVQDILTEFGFISLKLKFSEDRSSARISIKLQKRNPPKRIFLHTTGWTSSEETMELPFSEKIDFEVKL